MAPLAQGQICEKRNHEELVPGKGTIGFSYGLISQGQKASARHYRWRRDVTKRAFASGLFVLLTSLAGAAPPPTAPTMGEQANGKVLVPTNQTVTPIGLVRRFDGERPKDLALSPDGKLIAVLAREEVRLFQPDGNIIAQIKLRAGPLGLAWTVDSRALFVSGDNGEIYRLAKTGQKWEIIHTFFISETREDLSRRQNRRSSNPMTLLQAPTTLVPEEPRITTTEVSQEHQGNPQVTGLDVSVDGDRLYAALGMLNSVAVINARNDALIATVPVGIAPYRVAASPDGKTLYVANRGGGAPRSDEPQARSAGSQVRIDPTTDAAFQGSVSVIDDETLTSTQIVVGRQPSGLAVSSDGGLLYVANSDDDTIQVIDTKTQKVEKTVLLTPPQDPGFGQMPTDLALSADGKWLYVACGGANAVAIVSLPQGTIAGYLPTAWFPIALAEHDGTLFVASSKGFGSRFLIHNRFASMFGIGTVQFITPAARQNLPALSQTVADNNLWHPPEGPARPDIKAVPIPARTGEPSVFKHVVYIIKENHTYDLDLGDMPEGNGDKSLCLFGEEITPNEHALAKQFVLLDNTYTSGTNSADGHQWTDAALTNAYLEQNFNDYARSYPYEGGDPLAVSPAGFIWDAAIRAGKRVRVYGEFANKPQLLDPATGKPPTWKQLWTDYCARGHKYLIRAGTDNGVLKNNLDPNYLGFPLLVSDQYRASEFLRELKGFNHDHPLPDLSILLLPCNHTGGTRPDMPTPRAFVADNDLALGRIVEGISHSEFWKDTLILVIEDDSRFGLDHVDGHRTLAFCISPYTRRGAVVSEPYNHTSLVRTIGLVLGLPALNRFDRTATPMTACFASEPDFQPFTHLKNRQPLDEMNPPVANLHGPARKLAEASNTLDLSEPDRADALIVARAAWSQQRPHEAFPQARFRVDKSNPD